jgi:HD-GYP domain-containing protein (c-di-GMP phosphodiesterase class II)
MKSKNPGNHKLERLIQIGIALSAEKSHKALLQKIITEAMHFTNADGGSLYLTTPNETLKFVVVQNKSLNIYMQEEDCEAANFRPIPLFDSETKKPNHQNVVSHAVLEKKTINIRDAYHDKAFDFSGTKVFDARTGYHSQSFLTIPMLDFNGQVVGALQLINAIDIDSGKIISFPKEIIPLIEALASQAAVAISNQILLQEQKDLFMSFVKVLSDALDSKSPYTGGHCRRVPILAHMLAEQVCNTKEGVFADFSLSESEWEALELAAGLHDCGKVTTPEYVVDKATKLETIYNRIHEIRTRFEVLKRDAEINYLKQLLSGEDPIFLSTKLQQQLNELDDDFNFVALMNVGGESITSEQIDRLRKIGAKTWVRTLNDRIGLSHEELKRKNRLPAPTLPVKETLLQDRIDHLIEHYDNFEAQDHHTFAFRKDAPKYRFNLGEMYNLSIGRGTLSPEERYIIANHVAMTFNMLSSLPFPDHLKQIPIIAGGHHEQLNGDGYPDKLTADKLGIPARIIAIADVFEALTAADRPYKPAKKLSHVISLMKKMADTGHIDRDLFLKTNIHKIYGRSHLQPDQLDV